MCAIKKLKEDNNMRFTQSFALLTVALSFGATMFDARPAQALPCCSSPKCMADPDACPRCNDCVDVQETVEESSYDEAAGICYAPVDVDAALTSTETSVDREQSPDCQ